MSACFEPLGMRDTTFWPSGQVLQRLAKSYKPANDGLEECPIGQLKYPLDDPQRQPMPAGGLFSTAADLSRFYQMLANNGTLGGKRILTEQAVREMETPQPGNPHYGLGIGTDGNHIGHGGAYGTNSAFEKKTGLITIFLVQQAGWSKDGEKIVGTFEKAAREGIRGEIIAGKSITVRIAKETARDFDQGTLFSATTVFKMRN